MTSRKAKAISLIISIVLLSLAVYLLSWGIYFNSLPAPWVDDFMWGYHYDYDFYRVPADFCTGFGVICLILGIIFAATTMEIYRRK
jgi:hypothetical protein